MYIISEMMYPDNSRLRARGSINNAVLHIDRPFKIPAGMQKQRGALVAKLKALTAPGLPRWSLRFWMGPCRPDTSVVSSILMKGVLMKGSPVASASQKPAILIRHTR